MKYIYLIFVLVQLSKSLSIEEPPINYEYNEFSELNICQQKVSDLTDILLKILDAIDELYDDKELYYKPNKVLKLVEDMKKEIVLRLKQNEYDEGYNVISNPKSINTKNVYDYLKRIDIPSSDIKNMKNIAEKVQINTHYPAKVSTYVDENLYQFLDNLLRD